MDELIDKIAPYRHLVIDFYKQVEISHPKAEIVFVNEARTVYKFRKDEISAAQLIEDISKNAPIKEISLQETKIDDIIRAAYKMKVD